MRIQQTTLNDETILPSAPTGIAANTTNGALNQRPSVYFPNNLSRNIFINLPVEPSLSDLS